MRNVKVHYSDGTFSIDGHSLGAIKQNFEFYPGDFCIVEPPNIKKLKHRSRHCQLTGEYSKITGKVGVKFLDNNRNGFVEGSDLIPNQHN